MKARLVSSWGVTKGSEFVIGAEATVGRNKKNTIVIESKPVSSKHARIYFEEERGTYYLEDLGSLNGTEIDGVRIVRAEPLSRLHVLRFGGVAELLFVEVDRTAESDKKADAEAPTDRPEGEKTRIDSEVPELPTTLRDESTASDSKGEESNAGDRQASEETEGESAAEKANSTRIEKAAVPLPPGLAKEDVSEDQEVPPQFLLVIEAEGETKRVVLEEGENTVGRSLRAEVQLPNRDLSRRHAVLTVRGERVTLRDLGSRNHTFVDGRQIEDEVKLDPGAVVLFGPVEARLLARGVDDAHLPPKQADDES